LWKAVRLGACFGLLSGALEGALYWGLQEFGWLAWDDALLSVGPQQIVVSAAANLVAFSLLSAVLAFAARALPWPYWPQVIMGLLSFQAFLHLVDLSGRMRMWASVLLALGLAVQFARWAERRGAAVHAWIQKVLPRAAMATVGIAVLLWGGARVVEQVRLARLPAAPAGAPNVLLIVLDTVRPDHMSCYGEPRPTTPALERLARQSVLFERAYATSSWTLPSHVSMMTGLLPAEHGATVRRDRSPLHPRFPVLSEELGKRGYVTGGFVANTVWGTPWMGLDRGFLRYESYYRSPWRAFRRSYLGRQLVRWFLGRLQLPGFDPLLRPSASEIRAALLRWVDATAERPFFAFLNYMEAHQPIFLPPGFARKFSGMPPGYEKRVRPGLLTEQELANREEIVGRYDSAIAYLDAEIEFLLEELRRRGRLQNTLLIVTSDHGELFGRHGIFDHGNSLYEEVIQVPLILHLPGRVPGGLRVSSPVSHRDLPATILDLALPGQPHALGGLTLVEGWNSTALAERPVISEIDRANFPGIPEDWPVRRGWLKTLILGKWKFILHEDGSEELYDLSVDALERNNLSATAEGQVHSRRLRQALFAAIPGLAPTALKATGNQ
jgi:arylsulfatase A-like enzyme